MNARGSADHYLLIQMFYIPWFLIALSRRLAKYPGSASIWYRLISKYFLIINYYLLKKQIKKKYIIRLSEAERQELKDLVCKGKAAAYRRTHVQILILTDAGSHGPGLSDAEVADWVEVNERTVSRLSQRCVDRGLDAALERQARVRANGRPPWLS